MEIFIDVRLNNSKMVINILVLIIGGERMCDCVKISFLVDPPLVNRGLSIAPAGRFSNATINKRLRVYTKD